MCILDLSDAYLTVPINGRFVRFLKFRFNSKVYCYVCLPFGISSAVRKFTKLLKPIVAWLRLQCIVLVIYIDDIWLCAQTYDLCFSSMMTTAHCLYSAEFLVNRKKSKPKPSQEVVTLGYVLNSHTMTISLPPAKETDVLHHCDTLYHLTSSSICYVARVLGKLIACLPVLPLGCAHYRYFHGEPKKIYCGGFYIYLLLLLRFIDNLLIVFFSWMLLPMDGEVFHLLILLEVSLMIWNMHNPSM